MIPATTMLCRSCHMRFMITPHVAPLLQRIMRQPALLLHDKAFQQFSYERDEVQRWLSQNRYVGHYSSCVFMYYSTS